MRADEERTRARLAPIAVMPNPYFESLSFETAGSLICLNTHLALDVGVFRTGELAARKRDEHGRVLAVAAILVAELLDQIALFQLDGDQNVAGDHHRELRARATSRTRTPEG
jgi:hypothetical protein